MASLFKNDKGFQEFLEQRGFDLNEITEKIIQECNNIKYGDTKCDDKVWKEGPGRCTIENGHGTRCCYKSQHQYGMCNWHHYSSKGSLCNHSDQLGLCLNYAKINGKCNHHYFKLHEKFNKSFGQYKFNLKMNKKCEHQGCPLRVDWNLEEHNATLCVYHYNRCHNKECNETVKQGHIACDKHRCIGRSFFGVKIEPCLNLATQDGRCNVCNHKYDNREKCAYNPSPDLKCTIIASGFCDKYCVKHSCPSCGELKKSSQKFCNNCVPCATKSCPGKVTKGGKRKQCFVCKP